MGEALVRDLGGGARRAAVGLAIAFIVLLLRAPSAFAVEEAHYVFEPVRSLTGTCASSSADPIPDPAEPSCPAESEGAHPPAIWSCGETGCSGAFTRPSGAAVDASGDIYVASYGNGAEGGKEGRIDIFNPEGFFISEMNDPHGPRAIAVDSEGTLYIHEIELVPGGTTQLVRCAPDIYVPESGEIAYDRSTCVVVRKKGDPPGGPGTGGMQVDPTNDHLFVAYGNFVAEFGSAEEGNPLLDSSIGEGALENNQYVAIDALRGLVYASRAPSPELKPSSVKFFELGGTHALLGSITAGCGGKAFATPQGSLQLAVNEDTGSLLVADLERSKIFEFDEAGDCTATIQHGLQDAGPSAIAVDNSPTSPNQGYLFVTSGESPGHSYAFAPIEGPEGPTVTSVSVGEVDEAEAELRATIDSGTAEATYQIEYMTRQAFEEAGETFTGSTLAAEGTIAPNTEGFEATATAAGLQAGTEYVFRARAESETEPGVFESDEEEGAFGTFPEVGSLGQPCANEALRTGASAALPDCRAYELVTPADTNGHIPRGGGFAGIFFDSPWASPQGDAASFVIEGGSLPGFEGTGSFNGENYTALRTPSGWQTHIAGPNGAESEAALPGSPSPDQSYNFWVAPEEQGPAAIDGKRTTYVRYPDGHSALIGRGSLGVAQQAQGLLIAPSGSHVVFTSASAAGGTPLQLEPNAPPEGTTAIYDRTADEVTHVVSLLPGDVTPAAGEAATFLGASADANGIAFQIGSKIYVRVNNQTSFEVAAGATFAGISEGGTRVFYLKGGDLFAFDTASEETIAFSASGDVTPVNVAAGGTRAYFVSPGKLTGEEESEASPEGTFPVQGGENLYLSEEGALRFLGTVTERDVEGEKLGNGDVVGLGRWTKGLSQMALALDPSRTNPAGNVLLFESRADLTGFDPGGKAEVYRYDASANTLDCLSCEPARKPPAADASLQSIAGNSTTIPLTGVAFVPNLNPAGDRAFFQSTAPLIAADTDHLQDVYEWEEAGVGSCETPGGCTYLISSPHSERPEYLYGMSEDGNDVFFSSEDQLLPSDTGAAASLYDARVGGGFAEAEAAGPCVGEGCRPVITPPPVFPGPEPGPSGNRPRPKPCPKGKHRAKRHGKKVCLKNRRRHAHHNGRRAGR